ncbi:unnamed protein product, partial [Caretta caretta]
IQLPSTAESGCVNYKEETD